MGSTARSEETPNTQSDSEMSSLSQRPEKTSECFTMLREDSPWSRSSRTNLASNCARLREDLWVRTRSHTSSPMTPEPSDSPTQLSMSTTLSKLIWKATPSPKSSLLTLAPMCSSQVVTIEVESV